MKWAGSSKIFGLVNTNSNGRGQEKIYEYLKFYLYPAKVEYDE